MIDIYDRFTNNRCWVANANKDILTTTFVAFEENDYETLLRNIFTATRQQLIQVQNM